MPNYRPALFLCALAFAACKQQSSPNGAGAPQAGGASTQAAAPSGNEIMIGATLPLTGSESRTGGFYKEGYELAFEEANKNGGIDVGGKKMQVRLTLLDDTSAQATAASLADRLINSDKVQFMLGTYATNLVEAQSVVAESIMRWVDTEQQAGKIPKPATIALLWENTSHGKDFRKGVTGWADKTK